MWQKFWRCGGLNPGPFTCKANALPLSYIPWRQGASPMDAFTQRVRPPAPRVPQERQNNVCTHGGTRTPNLRFRRPTPYPLGHAGTRAVGWVKFGHTPSSCPVGVGRTKQRLRRPGIEPGSQEWESCMIPLHQRRRHGVRQICVSCVTTL